MDVLVWISTGLLVLGVGGVALFKLSGNEQAVEQANRLGYEPIRRATSVAELLGLVGVVIGAVNADLRWLGVLSAVGIAGMMVGAIVVHLRAGDRGPILPSALMLISSALYIVALTSI